MRIRFKRAFPAYEKGKIYDLPDELCTHYLNAAVAEIVDVRGEQAPEEPLIPARDRLVEEEAEKDEPEEATDEDKEPEGDNESTGTKRRTKKTK